MLRRIDRGQRFRPLSLESLEARALLAQMIWDGEATDANWSSAKNWAGDVAPQAEDNLFFPAGAPHVSTNDYAAGTRFRSVTISESGYVIGGNQITLTDGVVYNAVANTGSSSLNTPLSLLASQTFFSANLGTTLNLGSAAAPGQLNLGSLQTLSTDGRGNISVQHAIVGSGGLTKNGDGTLILAGNNTFEGLVLANQGVINVRSDTGLGSSATAGTILGLGTALQLQDGITVNENIVTRDVGLGFTLSEDAAVGMGGIRSISGANKLTGVISMTNHGSFGVNAGSTLNVSGQILVEPGVSDGGLTKFGRGTLELSGDKDNVITGQVTVVQGTLLLNKDRSGAPTPMPFNASLVIGDNRDGVTAPEAAVVKLGARDQIPETTFFKTNITTVTVNSNGTLDLNGFSDQIGALTMLLGRSDSANVTTGAGTLSLLGDITVNAFQGSSGASPAATIAGKLDLGTYFSGVAGGTSTRTINVNDTALFSLNADLIISANISGADFASMTKAGAGTLRLAGTNTYTGPTRLTAGMIDVASDAAFGASSLVAISSGFLRSTDLAGNPAAHTSDRLLSFDGNFGVYGSGNLTFTAQTTLTGSRTITVFDPQQVTTLSTVDEYLFPGAGLTKLGRGELNITGAATFTGALTIGTNNTGDGGTVRFSGAGGMLVRNYSTITVGANSNLILDNTAANNNDRLPDATTINTFGTLRLIANASAAGTSETVGNVAPQAGFTSTIESDTTGTGPARLNVFAFNPVNSSAVINFVGGGTRLTENGQNQINLLQAASTNLVINNNVVSNGLVINPDGSFDFATVAGGANGLAIIPLPGEGYVTSFEASSPTSNVKILSGTVTLDKSRTVNALLLGPNVTIIGADTTATLTVNSGPLLLHDKAKASVPYLQFGNVNAYVATPAGASAEISGIIPGTVGNTISKGGGGALTLSGANQFSSAFIVDQGILNVTNAQALGATISGTTVNIGAQIQLQGNFNVIGEALTASGLGPAAVTYGVGVNNTDGAIYVVSGNVSWAGPVTGGTAMTLGGVTTVDATALFPNGTFTTFTGSGVNVASGASLNVSGILAGGADIIKLGGGQMELSGTLANTISQGPRIKQGTLLLNKLPGVTAVAVGATFSVGSDVPSDGLATLKFGQSFQLPTNNILRVASTGKVDLAGNAQIFSGLVLDVGPEVSPGVGGGAVVDVGANGTLTVNADISVQTLGGGNPRGAAITGGTFAINIFNDSGAAFQRNYIISDGAVGNDLTISSAIVDGTGFRSGGIIKAGFGQLQFDGATSNTYTGTTSVNEGTLLLNKTGGAQAMMGPLNIGDNSLQSGAAKSDVVRLLQDNQLPDYQAAINIFGTGWLDLAGKSDAIGQADGQTALTVTSGFVTTGAGKLTVNGDIVTNSTFVAGTLPGNNNVITPATISGNLGLGDGYLRTITNNDRGELLVDAVFEANLSGSADIFKKGAGGLVLSGTNTLTGSWSIDNNPGFNQPTLLIGSKNALGSGVIYPINTVQIGVDGGPQTIDNRVITQDLRISGGNDLTFGGAVDLTTGINFGVFAPINVTFAGGFGELIPNSVLNKNGPGFLIFTKPALFTGALTINADGGAVILSGAGSLPNVASIAVNIGSFLGIDNRFGTIADVGERVRNAATITLTGGSLSFWGNKTAAVNEVLGNLSITTASGAYTSTVASYSLGQPTSLAFNSLARAANSFINFGGYGFDLGTANNQLVFYTPPLASLVNGMLPFATLAKVGDLDFAAYDPVKGLFPAPFKTSLAGALGTDNVKLKAGEAVPTDKAVNALLITGTGVNVTGAGALTVGSGLLVGNGANNSIANPLLFGGAQANLVAANLGQLAGNTSLTLSGAIDGEQGVVKYGFGRIALGGANTYGGITAIQEGVLTVSNSAALGFGDNTTTHGTTVAMGAALELDGGATNLTFTNEFLTLNGVGFGFAQLSVNVLNSGNTGALRSVAGANTWASRLDMRQDQGTNYEAIGVDSGSLTISSAMTSNNGINLSKVGPGTLEFSGNTANTFTGGTFVINEGTMRFNKTAGLDAITTPFTVQVGDNVGAAGADQLVLVGSNQINDAATVNVQGSGLFNLNNQSESLNATLTLVSGLAAPASVATGTGTLTINIAAYVTVNAQGSTFGNVNPVTITGILALSPAGGPATTRTITTNEMVADVDLRITAKITDGDGNANLQNITTGGSGRLDLAPLDSSPSDFSGVFTVAGGRTLISTSSALGASGVGAGTAVNNGTSLELKNVTITDELLTLTGQNNSGTSSGFAGAAGTLVAVSGSSVWKQNTVPNLVTLVNYPAFAVHSGATLDVSAAITGGTGLVKYLPGMLIFSGNASNTYGGNSIVTRVWEGDLRLNKTGGAFAIAASGAATTPHFLEANGGIDFGNPDDVRIIWDQDNQIAPGAVVRAITSALIDLNNHNETLSSTSSAISVLEFWTGTIRPHVRTGTGTLTLSGANSTLPTGTFANVNVNNSGQGANSTLLINQAGPLIEGNLNLGGGSRTFTVPLNNLSQNMLQIDALISNGQLNKAGSGTLLVTNSGNTYAGLDEVQSLPVTVDGNLRVTYRGVTGSEFNSTGDTTGSGLKSYLETNFFGANNVQVARTGANTAYTVTFVGAYAKRDLVLVGLVAGTTAPVATVGAVTETIAGGGTIISAPAGNGFGQAAIAVGSNTALGTGGVSARSVANNSWASLRSDKSSIVLPNVVDVSSATGAAGFFVLSTIAPLGTTFTYANTVSVNFAAAGVTHVINAGPSLDGSPTILYTGALAGGVAMDLSNVAINFRNFASNVTEISGSIIDSPTVAVQGTLNKQAGNAADGTGLLILSGNNTYDGTTSIAAGIIRAKSAGALGAATTAVTNQLVVTRAASATLRLLYNGQTTPDISIDTSVNDATLRTAIEDALRLLSSVNQSALNNVNTSGLVTVTNPSANTFLITFDGALRGSANQVSQATTVGSATVTLIQAGGVGHTTIAAGAALELVGGVTYAGEFLSSVNGVGFNSVPTGAIRLIDGPAAGETTTFNGNLALAGATVIAVQAADDKLIFGATGQGQGQISGNQTLTKYGLGTLEFGGFAPNLNAAAVVVNEGVLRFNKPARVDALGGGGSVTVGDNIGGPDVDRLELVGVEQIPDNGNVAVNSSGLLSTTSGASVGDIQLITIANNSSAGSFILNLPGFGSTASLAWNAPASGVGSIQEAIIAINSAALTGKVTVTSTQSTSAAATQVGRQLLVVFDASLGDVQMMTVTNAGIATAPTIAYLAQARTETVNALTLTAGTGEAADVSLATGTVLITNADSTLGAQVATLFPQPASIRIQGPGSLGLVIPTTVAAVTRTYTVNAFVNNNQSLVPEVIISAPIIEGDATAALMNLNKSGRGVLNLTASSNHGGTTTVNNQGGVLLLSGGGQLSNATAITVNPEAIVKLDNSGVNNSDRLNDIANLTLSGGQLWYVGNATASSQEVLGGLSLTAITASILRSDYFGAAAQRLTFAAVGTAARGAGASLNIISNDDFVVGTHEIQFRPVAYYPVLGFVPTVTGTLSVPLNFDITTLDTKNGAAVGNANLFGLWTGTLTVSAADMVANPSGTWTFGTASDDGSIVLIDLDGDGVFSPTERVVNNNFFQGVTSRTGNVTFPGAGNYKIAIAFYQGTGGAGMEARFSKTGGSVAYGSQTIIDPGAVAQQGTWKDDASVANQLTEKWYNRAPVNVSNTSPDVDVAPVLPVFTNNVLSYATVTTFAGKANQSLDLVTDLDAAALSASLGRLTTYDAQNVKATSDLTLGASINALLIAGNNVKVTVPGTGTTIASGIVVNSGGATSANTIVGGALNFGAAEPLFFTQGRNTVQRLSFNGATTGQFTLTSVINPASAPALILGGTQASPVAPQTTAALNVATLSATQLQGALESLPGIGQGNVTVTAAAGGGFDVTFSAALAGGDIPLLRVNNVSASPAPSASSLTAGGGTLSVSSSLIGSGAMRKERKGTLVLGGDNQSGAGLTGTIIVNEGELSATHVNALGTTAGATTINAGAALSYNVPGTTTLASEPLTIAGTGYLNGDTGSLRILGSSTLTYGGTITVSGQMNLFVENAASTFIDDGGITDNNLPFIKTGPGTLELRNAAKFQGSSALFVNFGTVRMNLSGTNTANTHVVIGTNDGGPNAAKFVYASTAGTDQVITGGNITVNRSGLFDFNGVSDQFNGLFVIDGNVMNSGVGGTITASGGLTMNGGTVDTSTGTLALGNNVTINAGAQATIAGNLSLNNAQRNFVVADGPALYDVNISANVTGGGGGGRFEKQGNGGLLLSGNNANLTGSNEVQSLPVPTTITTFTISFGGGVSPLIDINDSDAAVQSKLELMPAFGLGNVAVMSVTASGTRTFTLTFRNTLGGYDVPNITASLVAGTGAFGTLVVTTGVWALTVNTGLIGIATDVPTTGGFAIYNAATQLFAEGADRTIKSLHIDAAVTHRLGSRRDLGDLGNNYAVNVSEAQLWSLTPTLAVDDPLTKVQFGGLNAQQLIAFPSIPASLTVTYAGDTTVPINTTGNVVTDAAALQTRLNQLAGINAGGGSVTVTPVPGLYSFKVTFDGGPLAKTNVSPLSTTGGGTVYTLARGLGSIIEQTAAMPLQKSGFGTLSLDGDNAFTGVLNVSGGIVTLLSATAVGQSLGTSATGTTVASGAALQIGSDLSIGNEMLTILGAGYVGDQAGSGQNTGALHVLASATNVTWGTGATPILLGGNPATTIIGVDKSNLPAGTTLILNAQLGQASQGTNNNALTKVGPGTLEFQGALPNTNFGVTTINDGTIRLNKRAGATSGLAYAIGDNVGAGGSDALEIANAEQVFDNQQHTVHSTGVLRTLPFAAATTFNEVQQLSVYGAAGTFTVTVFGSTTAALPFNIAPSGGLSEISSLQNALNALPTKPANVTFVVSGSPQNYTITFVDTNPVKTDQPALVAVGATATTAVATLNQGGTNVASEEQYVNTGSGVFSINYAGIATGTTAQSQPIGLQQLVEGIPNVGLGGVVVTGFAGQQQMLVTFTEGSVRNFRGMNVPDLAFNSGTATSQVTGTQGGYSNLETVGIGATSPVITVNEGPTSTGSIEIAAGTTLVLANDLTVAARPGLSATTAGVTISGQGSLALLSPTTTANANRTFTVVDGPASNDLTLSVAIVDGSLQIESQTITVSGTPTAGTFQLAGGPLTGTTAAIGVGASERTVWSALQPVLPAGVQAVVTIAGTSPNFTYTITFYNLPSNPATLQVVNNTMAPGAVAPATTVDLSTPAPLGGISKSNLAGSTASRLVISGNNTFTGPVTVNSGFLHVVGNNALGTASATDGAGLNAANGAVIELNNVSLVGEHIQLNSGIGATQVGLYDVPGMITVAQPLSVNTLFGSGVLRVMGNGPSSITGNVDLRGDATGRFFGIAVDTGSSLVIDGAVYGTNNLTAGTGHGIVKLGGGSLEFRGATTATVAGVTGAPSTYIGQTVVNAGTLVLNKPGIAINSTLTIGDGRGTDDRVVYGPLAGANEIADGAALVILASGGLDMSQALMQGNEVQLLSFDPTSANNGTFNLSFLGAPISAAPLTFSTTAATTVANLTAALNAFFGAGNFTVANVNDAFHYSIQFTGALAAANLPDLTASGVTSATVTATKIRDGVGNEVQRITLGGTSGGTVTAAYSGAPATTALTFTTGNSPTAAQVLAHLNTIPALNGHVSVIGNNAGPFSIVYRNGLGDVDLSDTAFTFATTGGTTATAAKDADGGNAPAGVLGNEVQLLVLGGTVTGGSIQVALSGYTSDPIPYNANATIFATNIRAALEALPTIGSGNVDVVALSATEYRIVFQGLLSARDVAQATVASALTGTVPTVTLGTIYNGQVMDVVGTVSLGLGLGTSSELNTGIVSLATGNITVNAQGGANSTVAIKGSIDLGTVARTLSVSDAGAAVDLNVSASLTGQTAATLNLTNPGTREFSGSARNVYAGNTTVSEGALVLNKSVGPNILGATFTIGDSLGGPDADVVTYGALAAGDQISDFLGSLTTAVSVVIANSGLLDLNGKSDRIVSSTNALTLNIGPGFSSEVRTGAGTITTIGNITANVTGNNVAATTIATPPAMISGNLMLGSGGTRTVITTADSLGPNDLVIAANVSAGGPVAGLMEGLISGTGALDSTSVNPGGSIQLTPRLGETNGAPWGGNQTWVYTGQFFDNDGFFAFAENIDDAVQVYIDGALRISNGSFNTVTTTGSTTGGNSQAAGTSANANPVGGFTDFGMGPNNDGWHNIEIRMQNGGGGAGAVVSGAGTGAPNWTASFGFGLRNAATNLTSVNAADYVIPADPGTGTLFRALPILNTTGAGRVVLTGSSAFGGFTTVSQGELVLSGGGALPNTVGITVSPNAKLTLDNSITSLTNRLNDGAALLLNGSTLNFIGNAAGTIETVGPISPAIGALSTIQSTANGPAPTGLISANLNTVATATINFVGVNADLGTSNQIKFTGLVDNSLLSYARIIGGDGGTQLALSTSAAGIQAIPAVAQGPVFKTTLVGATASDYVRLTQSETLPANLTIAGLEINGDNVVISGGGTLTISSGLIAVTGAGVSSATISAPLSLGSTASERIVQVDVGNTLTITGSLTTSNTDILRKRGSGTLVLGGNNGTSLTAPIVVEQGVLRLNSNNGLGTTAQGTTVNSGATLELAGGLTLTEENITLNGAGVNNTGALRLAADAGTDSTIGTNGTSTVITLGSAATINAGGASRTLTINGVATAGAAQTLTKINAGTLALAGSTANSGNFNVVVAEGRLNLAKTAAVLVAGTVTIGDDLNLGNQNGDQAVITGAAGQSAAIVVRSSGQFELNGRNFTANGLTLTVGSTTSGKVVNDPAAALAILSLNGNLTQNLFINANASGNSPPALIGADINPNLTLSLINGVRTVTLTDRTATDDLPVSSVIDVTGNVELRINATIDAGGTTGSITTASAGTSGRLALTAANTFQGTGATTILTVAANTIVTLRNAAALDGATGGAIVVNNTGTLEIDTATPVASQTRGRALTLQGVGATETLAGGLASNGQGALRVLQGQQTWDGTVTQSGNPVNVRAVTGTKLTFTGAYGLNGQSLTLSGLGTIEFQNTISGTGNANPAITVDGPLVRLSNNATALALAANGILIQSGSTFEIDDSIGAPIADRIGNTTPITLSRGSFNYLGNAAGSTETFGSLTVAAGTSNAVTSRTNGGVNVLTFTGTLATNAGSAVRFVGGNTNLGANNKILFTATPTVSNSIVTRSTVVAANGSLDLTAVVTDGANFRVEAFTGYYTGALSGAPANANVLITANDSSGAPATAVNAVLIRGNNLTVSGGTNILQTSALASGGGNNVVTVGINNTAESTFTVQGGTLDLQGVIGPGALALTKAGAGDLRLSGTSANTFSGVTNVGEGTLTLAKNAPLGTTSVTIQQGAAVALDGGASGIAVGNVAITGLNAFLDWSPNGGIRNLTGNNTWGTGATAIALLNSYTSINVTSGTSLSLSATISGNGLVKQGLGTLILSGSAANAYTGNTVVTQGTLQLAKTTNSAAVPVANLVIDNGATVQVVLSDSQIATATSVRVLSGGLLDLNSRNTTITDLTLSGSTVQTGAGVLTLNGSVHVNASATPSVISGVLALSNGGHNFNVADGAAADDLLISAAIIGGGAGTANVINKLGVGTLALTNVNTFAGRSTVSGGILEARNSFALGLGDNTTNNDLTVNAGATLRLSAGAGANVAVGNKLLTLTGALVGTVENAAGALLTLDNASGQNYWAGNVILANTAAADGQVAINVGAGTGLTLAGAISQVGTTPIGLLLLNSGTAELRGSTSNTYVGSTTVAGGTLMLNKDASHRDSWQSYDRRPRYRHRRDRALCSRSRESNQR